MYSLGLSVEPSQPLARYPVQSASDPSSISEMVRVDRERDEEAGGDIVMAVSVGRSDKSWRVSTSDFGSA